MSFAPVKKKCHKMSKFRLLNTRKVEVVNFCQILNLMSLMIFIQKGFNLACHELLKNYTDEPKIYSQHFFFFKFWWLFRATVP